MHPFESHKSLHTERLGKMLDGSEREKGPKAQHEQIEHAKRGGAMHADNKMHGEKAKHRLDKYKKGGKVKGKTHININVMPQAGGAGGPPSGPPTLPPGLAAAAMAPHQPMGPPPGAGPGGPPPGMPPGGPPPGMMHKRGGVAYKKGGSVKRAEGGRFPASDSAKALGEAYKIEPWYGPQAQSARDAAGKAFVSSTKKAHGGSVKAESERRGTKVQHAGQNDKKDIDRPPVITRKDGGRLFSEHAKMKDIKKENGGNGGLGRLAKARMYGGK